MMRLNNEKHFFLKPGCKNKNANEINKEFFFPTKPLTSRIILEYTVRIFSDGLDRNSKTYIFTIFFFFLHAIIYCLTVAQSENRRNYH